MNLESPVDYFLCSAGWDSDSCFIFIFLLFIIGLDDQSRSIHSCRCLHGRWIKIHKLTHIHIHCLLFLHVFLTSLCVKSPKYSERDLFLLAKNMIFWLHFSSPYSPYSYSLHFSLLFTYCYSLIIRYLLIILLFLFFFSSLLLIQRVSLSAFEDGYKWKWPVWVWLYLMGSKYH